MGLRVAEPFLAACAATLALAAAPVLAGDRASFVPLGYSDGGTHFAFEEYGYQDGSGFAFSSIYIIDLARDEWVPGSPVRQQGDDETVTLPDIRQIAREEAAANLEQYGIGQPAEFAAMNGDGAFVDYSTLHFGVPFYGLGEPSGEYELSLETFPADSAEPCEDYLGEPALGYALTLTGDGPPRELHRDSSIPASRGCPMDYRLFAVLTVGQSGSLGGAVAIVSVYPMGFEGPDRRFIAVPLD